MLLPLEKPPISVLFCADGRYYQHMAVTIASLLKNNSKHQFQLIAVLNERNPTAEQQIRRTVESFKNAEIEFKTFDSQPIAHFRVDRHITVASYLRLFMTQFLNPDVEKVLYLDCDLIVRDDIGDLWATDVSQYFLAAVADPYSDNHVNLGFAEDEPYFNAGVLLVNLAKWRKADVVPKFIRFIEENSAILQYHDQCTLNAVFRGQVLLLPHRWNFAARNADLPAKALGLRRSEFLALRKNPSILHYTTNVKPWLYVYEPHYKQLYYEYLALTPWRSFRATDRTPRAITERLLRMERLKEVIRWNAPGLFRSICRFTGLGDPMLRKLAG